MDDVRPQMPRAVAALIVGAIAIASVVALVWPSLRVQQLFSGPTEVGVVRRLVPDPSAAPRIGGVAPDFEWNAADGKTRKLTDLHGRVVVLNFWATWCQPCRTEMPALQRVAGEGDAVFLAVDLMEDGARVRTFMTTLGLDRLTPLLDTDGAVARAYSVLELPQTFFIDASGLIRHIEHGGVMDDDVVRRGIAKAR